MKKVAVMLILMLIAPAVCLVATVQGRAAAEPALNPPTEKAFWQYGVDSGQGAVRLFIRDKLGQVGDYRAVFVVMAPDRREYCSEKTARKPPKWRLPSPVTSAQRGCRASICGSAR